MPIAKIRPKLLRQSRAATPAEPKRRGRKPKNAVTENASDANAEQAAAPEQPAQAAEEAAAPAAAQE